MKHRPAQELTRRSRDDSSKDARLEPGQKETTPPM